MIDRRDFLRKMAGAGALIATAQLPALADDLPLAGDMYDGEPEGDKPQDGAMAQDRPEVFPRRGRYERLSLSYAVVEIGLEKAFSVLHISDSHLTAAYPHENEKKQKLNAKRTVTFGGRQEEALRDAIAWAKQHVEYIVHTGDLIDWQSEANFDLVCKYFGPQFIGSLGNHEYSTDMGYSEPKAEPTEAHKDRTRALIQSVYPFDTSLQSQVVGGVNFVTLDDVYGYVTRQQVKRFRKEVKKGLPIVLCMHVPFFTDTIWRAHVRFWKDKGPMTGGELPPIEGDYRVQKEDPVTRDFIAYLKKQPLLKCILAGHEHLTIEDQFSPTCREYVVGGGFLFHGREVLFI